LYKLFSGNEAIARGAYEAGVKVAAAYPGTPSTEILENVAKYDVIDSQWSPNEKVALEVAIGASIGGARALSTMKHVGVNVAADPLMSYTYIGVNGGLVLVAADDPGMHSSQNEQDSRYWGLFAKIPVIEPSDSQEAKDFVKYAFEISEMFDTPVILRTNTRVSHSKSMVKLEEPKEIVIKEYIKTPEKYVILPKHARVRHSEVEKRRIALEEFAGKTHLNRIEWGDRKLGIITSSINYQYVKEVIPEASVLKIGLAWPLNEALIKEFANGVERLVIVEELEPIFETQIKAMGIKVEGKSIIPREGELTEDILRKAFFDIEKTELYQSAQNLPVRPPILCPGCPHRGTFYVLTKMKLTVTGDIGCYTLGAAPPFNRIDTTICMGASIGALFGLEKALGKEFSQKTVGVIGDSTFYHSGMTGLLNMVYNGSTSTLLILDNSTTAMTGHQDHPGTGKALMGHDTPHINLEDVVKALGVKRVRNADPFTLKDLEAVLKEELTAEETSVIIVKRPCALIQKKHDTPYSVDEDKCIACKKCLKVGCSAISVDQKSSIDQLMCVGCGVCRQVCPKDAIVKAGVQ